MSTTPADRVPAGSEDFGDNPTRSRRSLSTVAVASVGAADLGRHRRRLVDPVQLQRRVGLRARRW